MRRIVALALPIMGSTLSYHLLALVDTAMVGALGTVALAGVGLAAFPFFASFALFGGLAPAVQASAARRLGEGAYDEAAVGLRHALAVGLALAVPVTIGCWFAAPALFAGMHDDPAVLAESVPYYQARVLGIGGVVVEASLRGFWSGVHRPRVHFLSILLTHAFNVVLSYALIFGHFGLPAMGTAGAGLGSSIALWIGVVAEVGITAWLGVRFGARRLGEGWSWASVRTLLRIFLPSGMQELLLGLGLTVLFWIVAQVGTAEIAAANVIIQLTMIAVAPGVGFGIAAGALVGEALGRRAPADAARWGWEVVGVAGVAMGALGLPLVLAPDLVLGLFLREDPATVALARLPLQLVGASVAFEAVGLVLMNALIGAGAARAVATTVAVFQVGLFLPAAYLVGPVWGLGLLGIAAAQLVQRFLQAATFALLWRQGRWAEIEV